jgi:hypothetical protein
MAGRILNRRELRKQVDHVEGTEAAPAEAATAAVEPKKRARKATTTTPKVKKPRKAKAPLRLRARWGVFDSGMKQIAIFDYNQRVAAEEKVTDLVAKKKGIFFLQIVKEPMPEPEASDALLA